MVDWEVNGDICSDGLNACGLLRSRFLDAGNEKISDNNVALGRNTAPDGIFLFFDVNEHRHPIFDISKSFGVVECPHNDPILLDTINRGAGIISDLNPYLILGWDTNNSDGAGTEIRPVNAD
jgi:hypothetical protein